MGELQKKILTGDKNNVYLIDGLVSPLKEIFRMKVKDRKKIEARIEQRKSQILDAATIVFSEKGYNRANTDEIAKKAGVGKGTLYRYFKDKKDIFFSVVDRGLSKLKEKILKGVEKAEDPLKKIENAVKSYLSFFEENKNFVGMLIHEQSSFRKRITRRYFEHYYGNVDRIKQTFKSGIEQGLIKKMDMDRLISVYASMLNGLIYMWQFEGRRYSLKDKAPIVTKIFFTGIIKDEKRRKEYEKSK